MGQTWHLTLSKLAQKQLGKMDKSRAAEVKAYLVQPCQLDDPATKGHGLMGPWAGYWRYRLGDLRIVCHIHRKTVVIEAISIAPRDRVY